MKQKHICGVCEQEFKNEKEYMEHLVDGVCPIGQKVEEGEIVEEVVEE